MISAVLISAVLVAAPPLELLVGTQKVLTVARGVRARTENAVVAEAKSVGVDQVLIIALAEGKTTLVLGKERRELVVKPFDEAAVNELHALAGDAPAYFGRDGTCVWAECPKCSAEQAARVEQVMALHPCVRSVDVIVPPRAAEVVLAGVRAVLGEGGSETPDLIVDVRGARVVIIGTARTEDDVKRLARVREKWPEAVVHVELRRAP
jgi:hypothetical protein